MTVSTEIRHAVGPNDYPSFDTTALRQQFALRGLFAPGEVRLVYTHYDRMMVGGAVPAGAPLTLDAVKPAGTASVLDRREMVVVAIAGAGTVNGHALEKGDMLYLGRGSGPVTFDGEARFYILSAPAHAAHPARVVTLAQARKIALGSRETSNERVINQFIVPEVVDTCQLLVGMTRLAPGSVWNTMPAHVHDRRMEAYLYIDLGADARVVHLMGEPDETRALILADEEGVLSPPWSIHCGAGTTNYAFIWAMAGDNADYSDVEPVPMADLR